MSASSEVMDWVFSFKKLPKSNSWIPSVVQAAPGCSSMCCPLLLPQWHLLCPKEGPLQCTMFREEAWIPQESSWQEEKSQGVRSSKGKAPAESPSWTEPFLSPAPLGSSSLSWKYFLSLTNTAYFSFVFCWAQTEAHYCLVFSQVEFLPLYPCISGIRRLRSFPGSCIFTLAGLNLSLWITQTHLLDQCSLSERLLLPARALPA